MQPVDLLLVNPPRPYLVAPHAQAPLGLLYLGAAAEAEGLSVRIHNMAGAGANQYDWDIPPAGVYGLTGSFLDVTMVNVLAGEIKRRYPDAGVVVGGPISLSAGELEKDFIRTVVHGEAELAVADIMSGETPWDFLAPVPDDLDSLPFPARRLWPGPLGGNVFLGGANYFGGGSATIITTRGCPFSCAFCAGPALASRKVRKRSPSSVVAEMEVCARDFGIRQFRFSDEFLTAAGPHVDGICEGILRSKVLKHGDGDARRASIGVNPHEVSMFKLMKAAGCREVSLGIESADPEVLALISKKGTPADGLAALESARAAGVKTRALLMVGTPGETPATLRHNLVFIRTAPFDGLAVTMFTPIPGCEIARDPRKFKCWLRPEQAHSLCVYGPGGRMKVVPAITVEGLTSDEFAEQINIVLDAAEATGKLGRG